MASELTPSFDKSPEEIRGHSALAERQLRIFGHDMRAADRRVKEGMRLLHLGIVAEATTYFRAAADLLTDSRRQNDKGRVAFDIISEIIKARNPERRLNWTGEWVFSEWTITEVAIRMNCDKGRARTLLIEFYNVLEAKELEEGQHEEDHELLDDSERMRAARLKRAQLPPGGE